MTQHITSHSMFNVLSTEKCKCRSIQHHDGFLGRNSYCTKWQHIPTTTFTGSRPTNHQYQSALKNQTTASDHVLNLYADGNCRLSTNFPHTPSPGSRIGNNRDPHQTILEAVTGLEKWDRPTWFGGCRSGRRGPYFGRRVQPFCRWDVRRPLYQSGKTPSLEDVFRVTTLKLNVFATIANLNAGKNFFGASLLAPS